MTMLLSEQTREKLKRHFNNRMTFLHESEVETLIDCVLIILEEEYKQLGNTIYGHKIFVQGIENWELEQVEKRMQEFCEQTFIPREKQPNIQQSSKYVNKLPEKFVDIDYASLEFNLMKHYAEKQAKEIYEVREKTLRQIVPSHLTTEPEIKLWMKIHQLRTIKRHTFGDVEELWVENRCVGRFVSSFDRDTMTFSYSFEPAEEKQNET